MDYDKKGIVALGSSYALSVRSKTHWMVQP
jgi:hypothetical protein